MKRGFTHGGLFHADEVMATAMLKVIYPDLEVFRVHEVPEDLAETDIVFDIGGGELDHHMVRRERANGVLYAACGLVWRRYGAQILKAYDCPGDLITSAWAVVENSMVVGIDARDNGQYNENDFPAYELGDIINSFNKNWDEETDADDLFHEAVDFASIILKRRVMKAISTAKARGVVDEAVANAQEQTYMVLSEYVPWQGALKRNPDGEHINYVVYPSLRGGYNVQVVPGVSFPEQWCGKTVHALREELEIPELMFFHQGRFLCAVKTIEGAKKLIRAAESAPYDEGELYEQAS